MSPLHALKILTVMICAECVLSSQENMRHCWFSKQTDVVVKAASQTIAKKFVSQCAQVCLRDVECTAFSVEEGTDSVICNLTASCDLVLGTQQKGSHLYEKAIAVPQFGFKWIHTQPKTGLFWISSGQSGVWATHADGSIWYKSGTYRASGNNPSAGGDWVQISGGLTYISSGTNVVWATNSGGTIYYRSSVSANQPTGSSWLSVSGGLSQISVSSYSNEVWSVNSGQNLYRRLDSSLTSFGSGWTYIEANFAHVSVGKAGVWAVRSTGELVYRKGTYQTPGTTGSGWETVHCPYAVSRISVGDNVVFITTSDRLVYFRYGMCAGNPTGRKWSSFEGNFKLIDIDDVSGTIWALDVDGRPWFREGSNNWQTA